MGKHPTGLYMLSTIEMWERYSYYAMRSILTLFMITILFFSKPFASSVYGFYTGFVYLTPILGGYIADRYWGNRRSIVLGAILMMIGQFTLALCAWAAEGIPRATIQAASLFAFPKIIFILALVLIIFGNGFFKPNISSMVTFMYKEGDERLDSAFTIFYMGINMGGIIAPIVTGLITGNGGPTLFKWGFLSAGIGMVISLGIFLLIKNKYLRNINGEPIGVTANRSKEGEQLSEKQMDDAILKKFEFTEEIIKKEKEKLKKLTIKEKEKIVNGPLTKVEKHRIVVIFTISFFAIFFWSAFEQAGVSLTFFAQEHVTRNLGNGIIFPTPLFQSLDPLFIVIFAPLFAALWPILRKRGWEPSMPVKISIGLFILALGFLLLTIPGSMIDAGKTGVSIWWMFLIYLILAYSELFISPTGQSLIAKLSPLKFSSILMGVWFLSSAASNILAGQLSRLYPDPTLPTPYLFGIWPISGFVDFFLIFTVVAIIAGIAILLIRNPINRWMHGIR